MMQQYGYGENVAAISGILHGHEAYEQIHESLADEVGGIVGLWSICADLAEVFTLAEAPYTAGEDFYRVEAIERFTLDIIACMQEGNIPKETMARRMAIVAIEKNKIA